MCRRASSGRRGQWRALCGRTRGTSVVGTGLRASVAVVALASIAGLSGCAQEPPPITGVDWHLESDRAATFRIDGSELSGTDSCNRIFGDAAVTDDEPASIAFGVLAATRMACPDDSGAQADMHRALEGRRLVEQPDATTLVLVDDAAGERWRFVA